MFNFIKKTIRNAKEKAVRKAVEAQVAIENRRAEGYVDTGMKILIAVIIGALLLAGLYEMGTFIRSGNTIVDYLINSKLSDRKDIQVLISGSVGNFSDITDSDMVSILGNILDNAIEVVDKIVETKRIELFFSKMKQNRIIVCKNTVREGVLKKNKNLITTKNDLSTHGLGHHIVESTVKKYNGFVEYFEDNDMFGVQISIPES